MKQYMIVTCKHGIYELPHELLNVLGLWILGNKEKSGKCLNIKEWKSGDHSSCQKEHFVNTSQKLLNSSN